MQVNFTREEYDILCELADHFGTKPAWMAHQWIMERAGIEIYALQEAKNRMGSRDQSGSNSIPRSHTIQEPRSKNEGEA